MIDSQYHSLLHHLQSIRGMEPRAIEELSSVVQARWASGRYGDLPKWQSALESLPSVNVQDAVINESLVRVGDSHSNLDVQQATEIALKQLSPWRKGPFVVNGVTIDTEWRSDWKWDRVAPHIEPLAGRTVLDVGCGSGYHCWRMVGDGAAFALGVEPAQMSVMQYEAIQRYANDPRVCVVPLALEDFPEGLQGFDTVFSMGVLYHRKSPIDHIARLKMCLRPKGQLVLETLVVNDGRDLLVPEGRYAKMPNVWFLPSPTMLVRWLERCGFVDVQVVDLDQTSTDEQRTTDWMRFESLSDFLDPNDKNRTREGEPAPVRAVVVATKR